MMNRPSIRNLVKAIHSTVGSCKIDPEELVVTLGGRVIKVEEVNGPNVGNIIKTSGGFDLYVHKASTASMNYQIATSLGNLFIHMGFSTDPEKYSTYSIYDYKKENTALHYKEVTFFMEELMMSESAYRMALNDYVKDGRVDIKGLASHFGLSENIVRERGFYLGLIRERGL